MKQSKFWSQQSAVCTVCTICMVCTVCTICMVCTVVRLLRSPTWSNFRWLGPFGFPCNTSPLMLFYATLSNFRPPARCSVDRCPTLKKADLENIVYVLLEKPKDSWCCSCVNNFLCVFPSLCFSFFVFFLWLMRAMISLLIRLDGWSVSSINRASDLISGVLVFATNENPQNNTTFPVCIYICQQNYHKNASKG